MSLRQKINALTMAFAADVVRALRGVPVQELAALSGKKVIVHRTAAKRVAAKKPRPRSAAAPLDGNAVKAALEFFQDRGLKGATDVQVQEHLRVRGFVSATADVLSELAARGAIRDAGIRRATGKGTAPVYVGSVVTRS